MDIIPTSDDREMFFKILIETFFRDLMTMLDDLLSFLEKKDNSMSPDELESWNCEESRLRFKVTNHAVTMGELYLQDLISQTKVLEVLEILLCRERVCWEFAEIAISIITRVGKMLEHDEKWKLHEIINFISEGVIGTSKYLYVAHLSDRIRLQYIDMIHLRNLNWQEFSRQVVPTIVLETVSPLITQSTIEDSKAEQGKNNNLFFIFYLNLIHFIF